MGMAFFWNRELDWLFLGNAIGPVWFWRRVLKFVGWVAASRPIVSGWCAPKANTATTGNLLGFLPSFFFFILVNVLLRYPLELSLRISLSLIFWFFFFQARAYDTIDYGRTILDMNRSIRNEFGLLPYLS